MRLKQLKLAGFKSFVDPVHIALPGQLVAVVGPNGCGKSNIIDAVRWVLGESSARQLRGESMQDVIFNGSGGRKPHSRASVELVFDNTLQRVVGPWAPYTEIAIKRILTRDGTSTYHINGQVVRRKDITDLFLGTGVGARGYAVIEQGMISRIIEARPEELRAFLEEAAGVSRYKERRKETEHRLTDARENLLRLDDIRLELSQQIERLERQAAVAKQYRAFQEELARTQTLLAMVKQFDARIRLQQLDDQLRATQLLLDAEIARQRQLEAQLIDIREQQFADNNALHAAQAALFDANAQVVRLEQERQHQKAQRQRLLQQEAQLKQQLAQHDSKSQAWGAEKTALVEAQEEAQLVLEEATLHLETLMLDGPDLQATLHAQREQLEQARQVAQQAKEHHALALQQKTQLSRQQQEQMQRLTRIEQQVAQLVAPDSTLSSALESELALAAEQVTLLEETTRQLTDTEAEQEQRVEEARKAFEQASGQYTGLKSQLAATETLLKASEGSQDLQRWWQTLPDGGGMPLWQQLSIDAAHTHALAAVLHERLQARPLDALSALPETPPPAAACWLANREAEPVVEPVWPVGTRLRQLVSATDSAITRQLDDLLAGVYLLDAASAWYARKQLPAGVTLVSPDGWVFTRDGLRYYPMNPVDAALQYAQQQQVLQQQLGDAQHEMQRCEQQLAEARQRWQDIRLQRQQHQTQWQQAQTALHQLEIRARDNRQRLLLFDQQQATLSQQQQEASLRLQQLTAELTALETQSTDHPDAVAHSQQAQDALKAAVLHAETQWNQHQTNIRHAEQAVQKARFEMTRLAEQVNTLAARITDAQEHRTSLQQQLEDLLFDMTDDNDQLLAEQLESALSRQQAGEQQLQQCRDTLEQGHQQFRQLDEQRLTCEHAQTPLRETLQAIQLQAQESHLVISQLAEVLEGVDTDTVLAGESITQFKAASLAREVQRLGKAIETLGAVNLAALDELGEAVMRQGYLESQANDLNLAIETLEAAIRRIDRETRSLLQDTFDKVNTSLAELFPMLFGGGRAQLELTGEEILDSGLHLMAQPPGKKNSTIHLLSGGEKALTALSLVFALFRLNPAPFCLLDEVDAPLDDANTGRFCDMVKRMSEETQFLYISHNKITMEMAEQLVGVTMQEQGVSRIVAVDVDEAMALAAQTA
ncbi:chromosome segregation protein SMC [Leeia oryzae]|uniref:chromosome segregation protein SMC n=1 Tax=Leeia oryzae TaxID=356662 RepID=UPI0003782807|nr:chromosome segregation protein SMC [Leeia oryzae]